MIHQLFKGLTEIYKSFKGYLGDFCGFREI